MGTEGEEDRSDTELLGSQSKGLHLNWGVVLQETSLYKMYSGVFKMGTSEQPCCVRVSDLKGDFDNFYVFFSYLIFVQ